MLGVTLAAVVAGSGWVGVLHADTIVWRDNLMDANVRNRPLLGCLLPEWAGVQAVADEQVGNAITSPVRYAERAAMIGLNHHSSDELAVGVDGSPFERLVE